MAGQAVLSPEAEAFEACGEEIVQGYANGLSDEAMRALYERLCELEKKLTNADRMRLLRRKFAQIEDLMSVLRRNSDGPAN